MINSGTVKIVYTPHNRLKYPDTQFLSVSDAYFTISNENVGDIILIKKFTQSFNEKDSNSTRLSFEVLKYWKQNRRKTTNYFLTTLTEECKIEIESSRYQNCILNL